MYLNRKTKTRIPCNHVDKYHYRRSTVQVRSHQFNFIFLGSTDRLFSTKSTWPTMHVHVRVNCDVQQWTVVVGAVQASPWQLGANKRSFSCFTVGEGYYHIFILPRLSQYCVLEESLNWCLGQTSLFITRSAKADFQWYSYFFCLPTDPIYISAFHLPKNMKSI